MFYMIIGNPTDIVGLGYNNNINKLIIVSNFSFPSNTALQKDIYQQTNLYASSFMRLF